EEEDVSGWTRFTSKKRGFTVLFPRKPEVNGNRVSASVGRLTFRVEQISVPVEQKGNIAALLDKQRDLLVAKLGAHKEDILKKDGFTGRSLFFTGDEDALA